MKTRHWAGLLVLAVMGSAACTGTIAGQAGGNGGQTSGSGGEGAAGGESTTGPTGSSSGTTGSSSSGTPVTCPPPVPKNHISAEQACGPSMPVKACTTDTDCVGQPPEANGKCVMSSGGSVCDFNQCTTHADCPAGNDCSCQNQTFGWGHQSPGSVCVPSNCHTDADCGAGTYCSPTVSASCGPFYGVAGYYCHTCEDTCTEDSDCPIGMYNVPGYCAFDPTVGHWSCGNTFCAG